MSPNKQPAKFRNTFLSTHAYLSPPTLPYPLKDVPAQDSLGRPKLQRIKTRPSRCKQIPGTHCVEDINWWRERPTEASQAAQKAAEYRQTRAGSEWALLDTLEVSMYNEEFDKRLQLKRESQGKRSQLNRLEFVHVSLYSTDKPGRFQKDREHF